jgi:hypothetical protein
LEGEITIENLTTILTGDHHSLHNTISVTFSTFSTFSTSTCYLRVQPAFSFPQSAFFSLYVLRLHLIDILDACSSQQGAIKFTLRIVLLLHLENAVPVGLVDLCWSLVSNRLLGLEMSYR